MTDIGYMRVSTEEQDMQLQYDALLKAGVLPENIYKDKISGATTSREGLNPCLNILQQGDTLVVWRLDRLGRGTIHLMELVEGLTAKGIAFKSLTEAWDTTTPMGKAMFRIGCVFAELEKETIRARIKAGIRAKMNAGRKTWGKPPANPYDPEDVLALYEQGESQCEVARQLGISKNTVARVIQRNSQPNAAKDLL